MSAPVIHWFRSDLRLNDNPALSAAMTSGCPVLCVFIFDEESAGSWSPGGASRWWLHHSLENLALQLGDLGGGLLLRRGNAQAVLQTLIDETSATAVYWTRCYEPAAAALERQVNDTIGSQVDVHRRGGNLMQEPERLRTGAGQPFKVFTPFWKALLKQPDPADSIRLPEDIDFFSGELDGDALQDWELLPTNPDWAAGLRENWTPGEQGAADALQSFLDNAISDYSDARDRPDQRGTSRLSPHLHFGEISPRQVWHAVKFAAQVESRNIKGGDAFLRELGWRDFSYHLLHHWPELPEKPFRENFANFPWSRDEQALAAWQQGKTGYPIVDAGMRELWHTGWMHNRVRMIAASVLVKHLLVPWQTGARWFWDTLVDADLANNSASWQWVAGCGADAAPYFRIFNPIIQGKKFDPDGDYVRRWVPELKDVPNKYIHEPWSMPRDEADAIGFEPGVHYPEPIVEHGHARTRALAAFEKVRHAT